jgi:2-iminoacetate synthase ThiH
MGRQIIKQPNGKYCIFSSVVNNIINYDMSPEDIIETWAEEAKKEITENVNHIIDELNKGGKPYYQFTMTYEELKEIYLQLKIKGVYKK